MIPTEAVEAAAAALNNAFAQMDERGELSWERCARVALDAAAPYILNQAPLVTEGPSEGADI